MYSAGEGKGCSFTVEIGMVRKGTMKRTSLTPIPSVRTLSLHIPGSSGSMSNLSTSNLNSNENYVDEIKENNRLHYHLMSKTKSKDERSCDERTISPSVLTHASSPQTNEKEKRFSVTIREINEFLDDRLLLETETPEIEKNEKKSEVEINIQLESEINNEINYNILVVDDSSLNRKMLCRVLRTSGHRCEEAQDGLMAVEKIKIIMAKKAIFHGQIHSNSDRHISENIMDINYYNYYDVILMDFVMPNMDGPTGMFLRIVFRLSIFLFSFFLLFIKLSIELFIDMSID